MTTILVLFSELKSYTIESELPEQLINAYKALEIEAFILPSFLLDQNI